MQWLTIDVAISGTGEVRPHTLSLRVCLEETFMDFAVELRLCNLFDLV